MSTVTTQPGGPEVTNLTRRLDHSVPDGDFAPQTGVASLTRRLDHSVPDGDFASMGTEV
ncbi:hypothetical protein [Streptomyces rubellomurinus]|uniref:hypothetical protein n=1 Tax=Streptomyces rubellomurinus (strain ATCC 31215) TaxID=359131 RepID=UPI000A88B74B|nr:hypothetical protein [Streptomyces rubellomurinus]